MSQLLLTPTTATVAGGINYVGGSDAVFVSNFSPTDDGHNYWAAYFQDDWKVTSKLTVNLGLRWEHFGQVVENHGRQANFLPNQVPGATAQYLEPDNGKNQAIDVNPQFPALLTTDNIALKFINNPAYNRQRRSASIFTLQLHLKYRPHGFRHKKGRHLGKRCRPPRSFRRLRSRPCRPFRRRVASTAWPSFRASRRPSPRSLLAVRRPKRHFATPVAPPWSGR